MRPSLRTAAMTTAARVDAQNRRSGLRSRPVHASEAPIPAPLIADRRSRLRSRPVHASEAPIPAPLIADRRSRLRSRPVHASEAPIPALVLADGVEEVRTAEVGPENVGEHELGVRALPQQVIRDP